MILILLTNEELLRPCLFLRIDIRSSRSVTRCFLVHNGLPRERNQVELLVLFSKKFHQVVPIARMSQDQFSTLEKIKHGRHPTLSSLLKRSFPKIFHGNRNQKHSIGLCRYQVVPIAPLS